MEDFLGVERRPHEHAGVDSREAEAAGFGLVAAEALGLHVAGDRRVLADIELLASNGYGEDAYGNNIALPDELSYLRR